MLIIKNIFLPLFLVALTTGCEIRNDFDTKISKNFSGDSDFIVDKTWQKVINFDGTWKFSIGDDKTWASENYNDENWESIKVPSSWENEGFHGYDGYAWYRKHFSLPEGTSASGLFLHLGFVDDVDEVYLNGNKIALSGSFPPNYRTAYNAYRRYYIPSEFINKNGENLLSVRVYDSQLQGGIVNGSIGLFKHRNASYLNIVLEGLWKFKTGDDSDWKKENFNDKNWENIIVPNFWEGQGFDYDGYAWYRKEFKLTEDLKGKKAILLLGKIDDFDEVYINGKFIGSTGSVNDVANFEHGDSYLRFRNYPIPENVLYEDQENVIAVRVYDGYLDGGIYEGPVGIISQENFTKFWRTGKH